MQTPQEKAEELITKMHKCLYSDGIYDATECAIVCCDQVLSDMGADRGYQFWSEVKYILQTKQNEKKRI